MWKEGVMASMLHDDNDQMTSLRFRLGLGETRTKFAFCHDVGL